MACSSKNWLEHGRNSYALGNYNSASQNFSQALKNDPSLGEDHEFMRHYKFARSKHCYATAEQAIKDLDWKKAVASYKEVMQIYPGESEAENGLKRVNRLASDYYLQQCLGSVSLSNKKRTTDLLAKAKSYYYSSDVKTASDYISHPSSNLSGELLEQFNLAHKLMRDKRLFAAHLAFSEFSSQVPLHIPARLKLLELNQRISELKKDYQLAYQSFVQLDNDSATEQVDVILNSIVDYAKPNKLKKDLAKRREKITDIFTNFKKNLTEQNWNEAASCIDQLVKLEKDKKIKDQWTDKLISAKKKVIVEFIAENKLDEAEQLYVSVKKYHRSLSTEAALSAAIVKSCKGLAPEVAFVRVRKSQSNGVDTVQLNEEVAKLQKTLFSEMVINCSVNQLEPKPSDAVVLLSKKVNQSIQHRLRNILNLDSQKIYTVKINDYSVKSTRSNLEQGVRSFKYVEKQKVANNRINTLSNNLLVEKKLLSNLQLKRDVPCDKCDKKGKIICPKCDGTREVKCPKCWSIRADLCPQCALNGKFDCEKCKAAKLNCKTCKNKVVSRCYDCFDKKVKCTKCDGDKLIDLVSESVYSKQKRLVAKLTKAVEDEPDFIEVGTDKIWNYNYAEVEQKTVADLSSELYLGKRLIESNYKQFSTRQADDMIDNPNENIGLKSNTLRLVNATDQQAEVINKAGQFLAEFMGNHILEAELDLRRKDDSLKAKVETVLLLEMLNENTKSRVLLNALFNEISTL